MQETREIPHVPFTEDMKKDYTILVPNMLPVQLKLITSIMKNYGYNMEVLETEGPQIAECGLKNVHNDTCYPALLVIGQFIDALESGKYDLHKVALMITQTGGGCRASNYIHLLRKALIKNGMGYIPVISLNFSGLEKNANPGFKLTRKAFIQVATAYCSVTLSCTSLTSAARMRCTRVTARRRWMSCSIKSQRTSAEIS